MRNARKQNVFHFQHFLLESGWSANVRLIGRDGVVDEIVTGVLPAPSDVRLGVGLPGMQNLHSHAFQRGMSGLGEIKGSANDSFWTWREAMYRFVSKINPSQLADIAALAYLEMLESGFTRVGEFHYLHHDISGAPFSNPAEMSAAIVDAADRTGIALTHLPVFYAHSSFGGAPPEEHQKRFIHSPDSFAGMLDGISGVLRNLPDSILGVAPHSLRAVTPAELNALVGVANGQPIHIHVAEQEKEVAACLEWNGLRPVEWLFQHAPVGPGWCLVHATHTTEAELAAIARSGAVAGLCPITEANLGDGIFPARQFAGLQGSYGIGTDSNVLIDMTEELRTLEYGQRLHARSRNVLAARVGRSTGLDLYLAALAGGRQALGIPRTFGKGSATDFITLDMNHPTLIARGVDTILDSVIFGAGRRAIDGVWRRGKQIVDAGRHHAREPIVRRYQESLTALLS